MDEGYLELVKYRFERAIETLDVAWELFEKEKYCDSNNRSYYAAYYAMKAVFATVGKDYKKHKTLMAEFNKEYVATEIFPRAFGKKISALSMIREQSDYNDFYVASRQESQQQLRDAAELIEQIKEYLSARGWL